MEQHMTRTVSGTALALLLLSQAQADEHHTTVLRSQHGTAVITQSGDPAKATTKIERKPGSTTITRKSGGNSSTVIQGSGAELGALPPEVMTPEMRRLFELMPK